MLIKSSGRISDIDEMKKDRRPENSAAISAGKIKIYVKLKGTIDIGKEKARLNKELENLEKYLKRTSQKLANNNFIKKAPEKIIELEKQNYVKAKQKFQEINKHLSNLD